MLLAISNKAQINLVSNYSFEDTVGSCSVLMTITSVKSWLTNQPFSTPDYHHTCQNSLNYPYWGTIPYNSHSYQYPKTGNAYVGIGTYGISGNDSVNILGESITTKLRNTLKINTCYYAEFYANLTNVCEVTTNQLGMLLTNNIYAPTSTYTNTIKPQVQWDTTKYFTDTLNWVKISGTFVAQGGEEYLTIGNFKDGVHLKKTSIISTFTPALGTFITNFFTYFNIDDVSLYELPNHTGTQSYTLCTGDSLLLGDTLSLPVRYQWSLNGVVVDTTKNIMVASSASASSATLTYVLQTKHCTTQTQTITIVVDDGCNPPLETEALEVPNVFTPNGDGVNDTFEFSLPKNGVLSGAEVKSFNVFNRWGNRVHELEAEALEASNGGGNNGSGTSSASVTKIIWDGRTTSGIECSAGVYFYTLEYINPNGELKKKNGYISLIKN